MMIKTIKEQWSKTLIHNHILRIIIERKIHFIPRKHMPKES